MKFSNMIKDLKILEHTYKFIVVDKYIIFEIFNFNFVKSSYQRLSLLEKQKYLKGSKPFTDYNKLYTTTNKTNKLLGYNTKVYNLKSLNVLHELFLSYIVIFLIKKYNYNYSEIIPNRISKTFWSEHIPDLLIKNQNETIYIEYERTSKNIDRLENNMIRNNLSCDKQIWICENRYIYTHVVKNFENYNINGIAFTKDEVIEFLRKECNDENYRINF